MKVLIVDDDATSRVILEATLAGRGHQVVSVADAEAAWNLCQSEEFPLVILDWLLPGMDGLDLCLLIRRLTWSDRAVILMNSIRDRPEDLSAALEAGATDYLTKPTDPSVLEVRLAIAERTAADLARRHRAESELREREARYRVLMENTSDLICEVGARGQFLYVSPNCRTTLGYQPAELIGQSIFARVHPEDLDLFVKEFERITRNMKAGKAAFRFQHNSGDWRWFESTSNVFRAASGDIHIVMVSRDVTDHRQLEEERLRASKLDSVGLLAGGIAHDFNNILTTILGNVSLATLSVEENSKIKAHLRDVEKACLRARDLTQRLLTFAKGGAPVKKAASLADLVRESVGFALTGSSVRCEYLLPGDLWPVEVDEGQISQVLSNLAINAQQAMPNGGRLTVSVENITLAQLERETTVPLPAGPYLKLRITDEGIGIAPNHLAKVFDPYFTTKLDGSGLGLATSYSITKNHGGYITVESELGRGTTFYIYLPASPGLCPPQTGFPIPAQTGQGRILVMDDDLAIRHLLDQMLGQLGYEVACAQDGAETVRLYREAVAGGNPFALVLMDLTVPGAMGGKDAIQHLRALDGQVKAIVLSGYSNDPIMADFRRYGFCGHLAKPYSLQQLSETLQQALGGTAPPDPDR